MTGNKYKYLHKYEAKVINFFVEYGTRIAFTAYAFVFGYYGFLKVQFLFTEIDTPVRRQISYLVHIFDFTQLGITLTMVMLSIGFFEMTIGILFALKKIRLVLPLFFIHMIGTFLTLFIGRTFYFQEPLLMGFPWLFDEFAAYILKNTIFIGGFMILAAVEMSDQDLRRSTKN